MVTSNAVSASAIAGVCGLDRDAVLAVLKEICSKFIEMSWQGKELKLDLKVGYLHSYPNGQVQFENYDFT